MRKSLLIGSAGLAMLTSLAAPVGFGQQQPPADVPAVALDIWLDIEVLRALNAVAFTGQQAAAAKTAVEPSLKALEEVWQHQNSLSLRTALWKARTQLLSGGPISEELWEEIARAERAAGADGDEGEASFDQRAREASEAAAAAFVAVLQAPQIARLGAPEAEDLAEGVMQEITDTRAQPPEEWKQWREEIIAEACERFAGQDADRAKRVREDLGAFLDRVREMKTDKYFETTAQLRAELAALLSTMVDTEVASQAARARERVRQWLEPATASRFRKLLEDLSKADRRVGGAR